MSMAVATNDSIPFDELDASHTDHQWVRSIKAEQRKREKTTCDFVTPNVEVPCQVGASWTPAMVLTDKRQMERTVMWVTQIAVCNRHRTTLNVDTVLEAMGGWDIVQVRLMARGHRKPKKNLTVLIFKNIKEGL